MDTLIIVKGRLKEPDGAEAFKVMKFSATHTTEEELFDFVNKIIIKLMNEQGMTIVKDETRPGRAIDNLQFWPMINFRCIDVEKIRLSAQPNTGPIQ